MYQVRCDDYILYDPRDEELKLINPKCNLETNTVGGASFTILVNHPFYDKLKPLRSVFEIKQDNDVLLRGRMTNNSRDFHNKKSVDLEGALAYTNDSVVPPFDFPGNFDGATESENIVEYFLGWVLDQHNSQVEEWQKLKLGVVTVADPNNYISRSSSAYSKTWDVLKSKLFESALGGFLNVRYEPDGNYVDYLSSIELTNTQRITLGENLLNFTNKSDASETYSAILPLGAEIENEGEKKRNLTIEELEDGELTDDLVKKGVYIYSKSAVASVGWICVPIADSTWKDVTLAENLKNNAVDYMIKDAGLLSETITVKALDLSLTDDQIQSFRINRNILVNSPIHGVDNASYQLTKLSIDIVKPQNTTITIGDTVRTLTSISDDRQSTAIERVEEVAEIQEQNNTKLTESIHQQMIIQQTNITTTCSNMILSALEQYVETGEYNEFKETVQAQLEIMSDEILMNFTTATESINNVNGDLQAKFNEVYKYISFTQDGITIGAGENAIMLEIDNDMILFKKNGVEFGWWDGIDFHTGNIVINVNERAQFGNFAFIPRSDKSLMFLKVGD